MQISLRNGRGSILLRGASIACALLAVSACASGSRLRPRPYPAPERYAQVVLKVRVEDSRGARIVSVPLEEYVQGCVVAELGPRAPGARIAGLQQVQALACRTYAIANLGRHKDEGFDLCANVHCQLYRQLSPAAAAVVAEAIRPTRGIVIVYGGRPIQALFHARCGGRTSTAEAVWGGRAEPYLQSVSDPSCARAGDATWRFTIDRSRLRDVLDRDPRTAVGAGLDRITVVERDPAGRAMRVRLMAGGRSRTVRGEELRTAITRALGSAAMPSTRIDVSRAGNTFAFAGRGLGHGVGLCQAGALDRARQGDSPEVIVRHYFPGTALARLTPDMLPAP